MEVIFGPLYGSESDSNILRYYSKSQIINYIMIFVYFYIDFIINSALYHPLMGIELLPLMPNISILCV